MRRQDDRRRQVGCGQGTGLVFGILASLALAAIRYMEYTDWPWWWVAVPVGVPIVLYVLAWLIVNYEPWG